MNKINVLRQQFQKRSESVCTIAPLTELFNADDECPADAVRSSRIRLFATMPHTYHDAQFGFFPLRSIMKVVTQRLLQQKMNDSTTVVKKRRTGSDANRQTKCVFVATQFNDVGSL